MPRIDFDYSCIRGKKLVYSKTTPLPFTIYEGMIETLYFISNVAAFSTICSPGYYELLTQFIAALNKKTTIVDDLFCLINKDSWEYLNHTNVYAERLSGLNRIREDFPHKEQAHIHFMNGAVVASVIPCAFLHSYRCETFSINHVHRHPLVNFIFQTGEAGVVAAQNIANTIQRNVLFCSVPTCLIDSTFVYIPAIGTQEIPVIQGIHYKTIEPNGVMQLDTKSEKGFWENL